MVEDIVFWRGQRVAEMTADELRVALADLYREHEAVLWQVNQLRGSIAKLSKAKGNKLAAVPQTQVA